MHQPLIIRITLQCNRLGVQDANPAQGKWAGTSEQDKTEDVPRMKLFADICLKISGLLEKATKKSIFH